LDVKVLGDTNEVDAIIITLLELYNMMKNAKEIRFKQKVNVF